MAAPAPDKQQKREARDKAEQAAAAFEAGDFKMARELSRQVLTLSGEGEPANAARRNLENLVPDRAALWVALGSAVVFAAAWGLAFVL